MAVPQDHLVDVPHEAPAPEASLRQRLERLPPNHPSYPFRPDGSRRPPVENRHSPEKQPAEDRPLTGDRLLAGRAPEPGREPREPQPAEPARPREPAGAGAARGAGAGTADARTADARTADTRTADTRTADTRTAAGLASPDRPLTAADGSWEWRGRRLSPEQSRIADRAHEACREAEQRLTPIMRRIEAQLGHGRLAPGTEQFALKSPERFKEKLASLISRYPDADPRELAKQIPDGVRYTFISEFRHYTEGVRKAQRQLADAGFQRLETRSRWDGDEYKGVNSRWWDPENRIMFEIQFHTSESWDAKQRTHHAYEKIKDPRTPIEDVERLRAYQREVCAAVPIPPGALDIEPYRRLHDE
jgi:hypothetical protein